MNTRALLGYVAISVGLASCGGGGGGGGGGLVRPDGGGTQTPSNLRDFTNATFANVPTRSYLGVEDATGVVRITEISEARQGRVDVQVERVATGIAAITLTVSDVEGQTFSQRFDQLIVSATPVPGSTSVTSYSQLVPTGPIDGRFIEYVDSTGIGFSYVALGQWASTTGNTAIGGFIPIGFETRGADIPTTGTASYAGFLAGLYTPPNVTEPLIVGANAAASADFGARSISFSTVNSVTTPSATATPVFTPSPGLNLSGTLTYAPGVNQASGTLTSVNGMTGQAVGRFYGPQAQELGGSTVVTGAAGGMAAGFILRQ